MAFKNDCIGTKENSVKTDCDIVSGKMDVPGCRTLHECSYNRPFDGDEYSEKQFKESLQRLRQSSNSFVIIGGGINLPGCDWHHLKALTPNCNYPTITHKFVDLLDDHALSQHTLDLFNQL